jgi:hypothetical protein
MKRLLTLATILGLGLADRPLLQFKNPRIKAKALMEDRNGANIRLCTADCADGFLMLKMERLYEAAPYSGSGELIVVKRAENFNRADGTWSSGVFTTNDVGAGVNATKYEYQATVQVGPPINNENVQFKLTALVIETNGTIQNGQNQTIPVTAGTIKFTVELSKWPFKSTENALRFGVSLRTKRRSDGFEEKKCTKRPGKGLTKTGVVDRFELSDSLFVDAPTQAIVDGVDTVITSSVDASGDMIVIEWSFPNYQESLVYDPVMGSSDPEVNGIDLETIASPEPTPVEDDEDDLTPTPSPTPTPTNAANTVTCVAAAVAGLLWMA